MKPSRVEFILGPTAYGASVLLIGERSRDNGPLSWTIRKHAANQRDEDVTIAGITLDQLKSLSDLYRSLEENGGQP